MRVVFVDEHGDDVTDIADSYFSDQGGINVSWAEDSNDATNAGGGKKNSKRKSKRGAIDPSPSMELPSIRVRCFGHEQVNSLDYANQTTRLC